MHRLFRYINCDTIGVLFGKKTTLYIVKRELAYILREAFSILFIKITDIIVVTFLSSQ